MNAAVLNRETFETSRELEYFTDKELTAQIGQDVEYWPIAILRELIDNALDACETSGVAPALEITTADDVIGVTDNGPGIPRATIGEVLELHGPRIEQGLLREPDPRPDGECPEGDMGGAVRRHGTGGF